MVYILTPAADTRKQQVSLLWLSFCTEASTAKGPLFLLPESELITEPEEDGKEEEEEEEENEEKETEAEEPSLCPSLAEGKVLISYILLLKTILDTRGNKDLT